MPKIITDDGRASMRSQIIKAAAEEFSQVGFDQAKMETISERAVIGKGTIYLYFKSKQDLFSEMLKEIAKEQLLELKDALKGKFTLTERLDTLLTTFNQMVQDNPDGFRIFISSLYGVNRRFKEEAASQSREFLKLVESLLEEARSNGEITIEIQPAALLILNAAQFLSLMSESHGFGTEFVKSQKQAILALLLKGVGQA